MTKVRTTLLDIPELENLDLKTETRDGKRHYIDTEGNAYPSVTTVCGLKTKEQIKLWRQRVGRNCKQSLHYGCTKRNSIPPTCRRLS